MVLFKVRQLILRLASHWHSQENKAIRLVIDESHQILSHRSFRTQFHKLKELGAFKVQKIYITGSLPIRLERRFLLETSLSYSTRIIRAPTYQPQISYNLFHVSNMTTTTLRLATDLVNLFDSLMESDQIGLIFCKSKDEADELHKHLTHCSSHSDLPTSERSHNESAWMAGHKRWIAATTGLIHGIDSPKVGVVIFFGLPYGLINTYQGAGRSGRDGRRSWTVVINFTNFNQVRPDMRNDDLECVNEGLDFLNREDCRRLVFSESLDGRHDSCLDIPDSHCCDVCDPLSPVAIRIKSFLRDPLVPPTSTVPFVIQDEYDQYNDSLDMIVDLPEEDLPVSIQANRTPPTHHHQPSPEPTNRIPDESTSIPRLAIAPAHLVPPTTNAPSTQILRNVQGYHQNLQTLKAKSSILNKMTSRLSRKCVLCFAYQGIYANQHKEGLWRKCNPDSPAIRTNWIAFKKLFQFPQYQNCFQCFLPQGDYLPPSHPAFRKNEMGRKPCPLEDFVVLLILFI
ncbi:MAG: hypothetical protein QOH50_5400, partial [Kribbellaceae bacterium]|nr:hypothetical protein [Kribbellaceae bacterium]